MNLAKLKGDKPGILVEAGRTVTGEGAGSWRGRREIVVRKTPKKSAISQNRRKILTKETCLI